MQEGTSPMHQANDHDLTRFHHDELYASTPPWDIGHPQPAFQALADTGKIHGRVLDVGCGTGEHALMAACLRPGRHRHRPRGHRTGYRRNGLLHIFTDDERATYISGLRAVLPPGGRYFHLGFSDREPGNWSHRRVRKLTQAEIVAAFADGWRIDSIEPANLEITTDPGGIQAWLVAATRT